MSTPASRVASVARYALSKLWTFEPKLTTPAVMIRDLRDKIVTAYQGRTEIRAGGVVTAGGTISASVLQVSTTALDVRMLGKLMAQLAAQTNLDLFTTSGAAARATYEDGTTAAAISLATDATAYVTVIAANTNGSGGAVETDNGAIKLIAMVKGTSSTYGDATRFLTSKEIDDALAAATGVHAGVTAWVHLANILWDENSASPQVTITLNRDNHLGQ